MMRQEAIQGKAIVLVGFVVGLGFAAFLNLPSARYTNEAVIDMSAVPSTQSLQSARAWQPMQPPMTSQQQFLQPLARMQSMVRALPPSSLEKKAENALRKGLPLAGLLAGPTAAYAAEVTPSLENLLKSIGAGGLVVVVAAIGLRLVADLDPVSRG